MLVDIKGPHLDFLGGPQQPFTRLCPQLCLQYLHFMLQEQQEDFNTYNIEFALGHHQLKEV